MASKIIVLCEEEAVEKKNPTMQIDRLTNLPQDLQLSILSSLDTKQAIQTSTTLSKTWVPLWTWIPVLDFNYYSAFAHPSFFQEFVINVLRLRDQSAKLHRLSLTGIGHSDPKFIKDVVDYAFTHSVEELEVELSQIYKHDMWPVYLNRTGGDFLKSLRLESFVELRCPFLGSTLKNLRVLYLKGAIITNGEPFLGFPMLERLTLHDCNVSTKGGTLSVYARNLSYLTISDCRSLICCELTTPKLRFLEYQGSGFPRFRTYEGLPILDTIVLDFYRYISNYDLKRDFENLLSLFGLMRTAKSVRLLSFAFGLLSLFEDELVKRSSPFENLEECLVLYSSYEFKSFRIGSNLRAYFLQESPEAKFTMINLDVEGDFGVDDVF